MNTDCVCLCSSVVPICAVYAEERLLSLMPSLFTPVLYYCNIFRGIRGIPGIRGPKKTATNSTINTNYWRRSKKDFAQNPSPGHLYSQAGTILRLAKSPLELFPTHRPTRPFLRSLN